jgi:hypothetical protein
MLLEERPALPEIENENHELPLHAALEVHAPDEVSTAPSLVLLNLH